MSVLTLRKNIPQMKEMGKKEKKKAKRVRIQDPNDDEEGGWNLNHIQYFLTLFLQYKEPRINVVTTWSKAPTEPYPIIENSIDPNNEELMDYYNENDNRNKLHKEYPTIPTINSTLANLPAVELVQPIPISLPTPTVPPRPCITLERTPLPENL